jgi:catalase (peroxidase I)
VDLEEGDNKGLEIPIAALETVVSQYSGSLSRADIWALATIVGAESSQRGRDALDYTFDFVGRVNCEDTGVDVCVNVANGCDPSRNGPTRAMPSPNLNTAEVLHFFSNEFGFGAEEVVALMGAHTIGEAIVENSGFDGKWVNNNERLDNRYYNAMIGDDGSLENWFDAPGWTQETINNNDPNIPTRTQWRRGGNNNNNPDADIMLNTDIALVRDFEDLIDTSDGSISCQFRGNRNPCPAALQSIAFMAKFKFSNSEWLLAFRDVLTKMVKNGYSASDNTLVNSETPDEEDSKNNIFD